MPHMRSLIIGAALLVRLGSARQLDAQAAGTADGAHPTIIRGFVDLTYRTGGRNTGRESAFGVGQYNLYITSKVTDRLSFLGETVFEFDEASSSFVVDVERVIAQYALDDHFRLAAGKVHTPLGYWSNAYHHGLVMQPTISRPQTVEFEDDGGLLPTHTVGALFSGRDLSPAHIGFDLMVGNGLGNRPTSDDLNAARSVTMSVHSQATSNLRLGLSTYRVRAVAGTPTRKNDALPASITQTIGSGFVAYFSDRVEAVVEGHELSNRSEGRTSNSPAWFVYAGLRVREKLVPYLLHESTRIGENDPYFPGEQTRRAALGLRWEEAATAVYKLELRDIERRDRPRASELALQLALAF